MEPGNTIPPQSNAEQPEAASQTVVSTPSKKRLSKKLLIVGLVVLLAVGVGGYLLLNKEEVKAPTQAPEVLRTAEVKITDKGFLPGTLTIKKGTVVIWVGANNPNPVIVIPSDNSKEKLKGLESPQLGNSASYRYQFNESGSFTYQDKLNPSSVGTIVVE